MAIVKFLHLTMGGWIAILVLFNSGCTPAAKDKTSSPTNQSGGGTENSGNDGEVDSPDPVSDGDGESPTDDGGDNLDDDGSDNDGSDTDGPPDEEVSAVGQLAIGFPTDLTIGSMFSVETPADVEAANASIATVGSLAIAYGLVSEPPQPPPPRGFVTKKANLVHKLFATSTVGDCAFTYEPEQEPDTWCYGPQVRYVDFPGTAGGSMNDLPRGDLGIWESLNASGEACVAAKMNGLSREFADHVDKVSGLSSMLLCIGQVEERQSPSPGESIDLMELQQFFPAFDATSFPFVIQQATYERSDMDEGGDPVYVTSLVFEDWSNAADKKKTHVSLSHVAASNDATAYHGKLQLFSRSLTEAAGCGTPRLTLAVSYDKESAENVTYEVRTFRHPDQDSEDVPDPFAAEGVYFDVNGNPEPSLESPPCGGEYGVLGINPSSGLGSISYAWVAGSSTEKTRSFTAHIEEEGTGSDKEKVGRGFFGYGPSMTELLASRDGAASGDQIDFITGFICNWAGPGGFSSSQNASLIKSLVQRQDVRQNNSTGSYGVDGAPNIAYAPTNSCDYTDPDGAGPNSFRLAVYPADMASVPNPVAVGVVATTTNTLLTIGDTDAPYVDLRSPALP